MLERQRFEMRRPAGDEIAAFTRALAAWDVQDPLGTGLRGGDFGWLCRNGDDWITANTRIWADDVGRVVAGGVIEDQEGLLVQIDPARLDDRDLAAAIVDGVQADGIREVSGPGAPAALRAELARRGAAIDPSPWPHLWRRLTDDDLADDPNVVSTRTDALIEQRVAVQRSAFERSTFTREKWDAMAAGPLFRPELDLLALNDAGAAWRR